MTIPEGDPRIRLLRTSHVIYYHADILKAITFLQDFGLEIASRHGDDEIFFRGYGPDSYCYVARRSSDGVSRFGGAAYLVESHSEFARAATVPGASPIRALDAPGGGEIVTLTDPVGHQVHLIWGQRETAAATPPPHLEKLVVNFEDSKPRVGTFQRLTPGPAPVHKWGHYGVTYPDGRFDDMLQWYTSTLALAISDIVDVGGRPSTAFFHIDRGLEYTDHHAFFFKRAKLNDTPSAAHAAFEVHDFDVQQLGHNHLEAQGYKLCWGVGRHVLGSQIFDYWFDCSGFILEHYADGDLVNCDTPVSHGKAGPNTLYVWGPPVPEVF